MNTTTKSLRQVFIAMLSVFVVVVGSLSLSVIPAQRASAYTVNPNAIQITYSTWSGASRAALALIGNNKLEYAYISASTTPADADFTAIPDAANSTSRTEITLPAVSGVNTYMLTIRAQRDGNNQALATADLFGISGETSTAGTTYTTGQYMREVVSLGSFPNLRALPYLFSGTASSLVVSASLPGTVTDLSFAFRSGAGNTTMSNPVLSHWDTSNVTNMKGMFQKAISFNRNINNWNVSQVIDMSYMFGEASTFNQALSGWNTASATNMSFMFYMASAFNQSLAGWNVSNVQYFNYMFNYASAFNGSLSGWNTSSAYWMQAMFLYATNFNQPINHFDLSNVIYLGSIFANTSAFNQPLDNWDTSKVQDMPSAFASASAFNQDLSAWNITGLTGVSTSFKDIFKGAGISQTNLENTYIGWAQQNVASTVVMGSGWNRSTTYSDCLSKQAFDYLDLTKSWSMWTTNPGTSYTCSNVTVDWGVGGKSGDLTNRIPALSTTTFTPNLKATSSASSPAIRYTVFSQGNTSCRVNQLTGVITYKTAGTCTVKAWDANRGTTMTAASVAFQLPTPGAVSSATEPTNLALTYVSGNLNIAFNAPSSNGGSAITGYKYRSTTDDGATWSSWTSAGTTTSPIVIQNLSGLTSPKYQILAVTSAGDGIVSATSASIPLATPPGAPTNLVATPGDGSLSIAFNAPSSNGGAPITNYEYKVDSGAWTSASTSTSPVVVTGLTNTTTYSVALRAVNSAGGGSEASVSGTPVGAPDSPTIVTSVRGYQQIALTWSAPANLNGSTLLGYKVTYSRSGVEVVATNLTTDLNYTITGLTNGYTYYARVYAVGSGGTSAVAERLNTVGAPAGVVTQMSFVVRSGSLDVSWTPPADNGGFAISMWVVKRKPSNSSNWTNLYTTNLGNRLTVSNFTDTGLVNGQSYDYQVAAVNGIGQTAYSETFTATPSDVPGAPTGLAASINSGSIGLNWIAPTAINGSPVTGYLVEGYINNAWTTLAANNPTTSYTATGLTDGTSYDFRVSAINSGGTSLASSIVSATPATPPAATSSVVATRGNAQASIAFAAPSNGGSPITSYSVYCALESNQLVWTDCTPSPGLTTSPIVVTGLTNGTSYVFKVVASNAAGSGAASSVSAAVTPATVPGAPSGLLVVPGSGQASLSFTGSASNGGSAITGYEYRYTWNSGANASTPVSVSSSTRSVTITGLTNGVAYNFEVRAVNDLGNSSWASTAQTTTPSGVPGEVVTSDAVVGNGTLTFDYALSSDGGSPVTDYQYRYSYNPRGVGIYTNFTSWISMNTTSDSTNLVMSNLHNGDAYVVQIRAVNANGYSTYRGNVNNWASGTPVTFPGAPTINTVTTDNGKITLGLTPPTDDGGSSIVHYMYQLSNDGGSTWSNPSTAFPTNNAVTILGLGNNTTYKVRVCANNGSTNTVGSCETHNTYSNVVDAVMPVAAVLVLTNVPGGAVYNQPLTTQPRIQLYNSSNQLLAVGGVEVTATIHTGTGSVVNATATTDSTGLAIFSNLKIVGTPAVNGFKLKFSITNLSTPATTGFFTLAKGPQAAVTMTNATSGFPGDQITLSAAGGSGSGAISYARTGSSTCTVSSANNVWTLTLGDAGSTCTVTATRATDVYYLAETSSAATITVAQRSQTLSFTSTIPSSPVSGGTYTPVAVSSESLTPTLSVTTNSVCTLSSGVVSFLTSGTCTIRATQAGNNNVLTATAVEQDIVVGMKNQNITFPAISDRSYGAAAFFAGATVDSDLPLAYTSTDTSVCTVGASTGMIQVKTSGTLTNTTCTITVSQASGDNRYAPANSVSRSFEVSAIVATAPYLRAVSMGNAQATVSFTAPQSNGGADIQYYSVVATSATAPTVATYDCVATPLASPPGCTILGLLNGSEYSFQVFALNTAGTGAGSNVSATYIPATNPDAVTALATVPGNTTLAISWAQPESLGGGAFTSYQVFIRERGTAFSATPTAIVGAAAGSNPSDVTATSYTASGLTNGTTYDVKVVVITTANTTAMESNTTIAWGIPATVPSAVNGLTVRALGETSAFASWTVPTSDGGSPITSYAVTTSAGTCAAVQGSTTSCLITGLTPGSQLSVSVKAVNDRGQSVAADASTTMPGTAFVPSTPTVSNSNTSTIGVAPYRATEVSTATQTRQSFSNVPTPGNGYEAPRSGEAVVLVNGTPVTPIIVINDGAAEITVPGSVNLTMWSQGIDGEKTTVEDGTQLVIAQGSDLVLSGSGFQPASPTEAWLFSDATLLGSGLATAKGTVSGKYGVASSAMLGDRTIQFNGVAADGSVVSVAVGVTIIAAAEDSPEAIAQNKAAAQQDFTVAIVLGSSAAVFLLLLAFYLRRRKQTQD